MVNSTFLGLIEILTNLPRRHSVLMLLSFSSVTNLRLHYWFGCKMDTVIQVSLDLVMCICKCCCYPSAACTGYLYDSIHHECSHLGLLALSCKADTLLIGSCLFLLAD